MADKIQLRRDTAANWTAANPVLAEGELGHERDTGKFKIGNGVDTWNALVYSANGLETLTDGATGDVLQTDGAGNYSFAPISAGLGNLYTITVGAAKTWTPADVGWTNPQDYHNSLLNITGSASGNQTFDISNMEAGSMFYIRMADAEANSTSTRRFYVKHNTANIHIDLLLCKQTTYPAKWSRNATPGNDGEFFIMDGVATNAFFLSDIKVMMYDSNDVYITGSVYARNW